MPLTLYRRHTSACSQQRPRHERTYEADERRRGFLRCTCPIQAEGLLPDGRFVRKSTGRLDWEEARHTAESWDALVQPPAATTLLATPMPAKRLGDPEPVTMEMATCEFLADLDARQLNPSTKRKYVTMVKQIRAFADQKGLPFLNQFDVDVLTRFRATWKDGTRSGAKKLERVRALFRFAADRDWIPTNPAAKLRPPVGASRPAHKHPFTDEEMQRIFRACDEYEAHAWRNGFAAGEVTGESIKTFILLLMYTGLRISDAATFSTEKLQGNNAFLFMHKTEEPVFTWLPDDLVERLGRLPLYRGKYYFMGPCTERKETAADIWRRRLKKIFDAARPWKVSPTPHRFRHTFARLLLQRGVPVDDVATLMGHSDPKITLKHYGRWVPERQERLTDILKSIWSPQQSSKVVVLGGRKNG